MPVLRDFKKYAKKATKAVGKRYGVSYGRRGVRMTKSSLPKIERDVRMIMERLNVEKKFRQGSLTEGSVAQVNVNAPGYFTSTITPFFPKGTGESERTGGSIKLTGLNIKLQLIQQNECYSSRKLKCCIIKSTDSSVTNAINDLWDINPLTNVVDYHSDRNYTNNPKAHTVLRTVYMKMPQRASAAGAPYGPELLNKSISLKMQQITRFEETSDFPKDCYYYLVIFADTGNSGGVNSSNTGVHTPQANTGMWVQEIFKWWMVDN